MSEHTDIEWCDSTVNPVMGCDGCELWIPVQGVRICYAGNLHETRGKANSGFAKNFDEPEMFAGRMAKAARWSDLLGQNRADKPWLNGMPRLIFVSDMGDALSKSIPFEYLRREIIEVAASQQGQRHIWQWLTKQPARMAQFSAWLQQQGILWPENLWVGTSLTDASSRNRIKPLLRVGTETTVRFLSIEPQWEEMDITKWLPAIRWIIQGGQSGKNPRPFDLAWARSMRDAARRAGVPYFLKQLGAHAIEGGRRLRLRDRHGGDWAKWPEDLRVREVPRPHAVGDAGSSAEDDKVPLIRDGHDLPHRHLPVVQTEEAPPNSKSEEGNTASLHTSELALYLQGERVEDAEARWELWAGWFKGFGSVLFRWLALASMHDTFWGRDPKIVLGYIPSRARGRKIARLTIFFHVLRNDTNIEPRTAYREIGYAKTLLDALGKERVLSLLGTRVANDARFLRDLARLKNEKQAKDVTDIYTEGAGEKQAKKQPALWLDIQVEVEKAEKRARESQEAQHDAAPPVGLLGPKPDPQQALLAIGLRIRDVLEVMEARIAVAEAKEDQVIKDIQNELEELWLRAEPEQKPVAPDLTPEPGSGPLTAEGVEQIRARIRELEALAEPLSKKSRKKAQLNREISRLELRLQAHGMEALVANLPDDEDE